MENKILEILEEICGDSIIREDLDINLIENDLIESLDYAELLVRVEEEFNISISPSELTREQMDTPRKIVSEICSRR